MKIYTRCLALCLIVASGYLSGCTEAKPDELIRSARNYIAKHDNNAAIVQLKSALQKLPDSAEARLLLGQTLLDSGDPVSAEVELRKALALKQPDSAVLPPLARALNRLGQDQKLIQQYAAVALDNPAAAADLKTSVAIAYGRQGKRKELDAALDSALTAVPDYGPARRVQARLKAREDDFDGAMQMLERVLVKAPDDYEAWQFKGELLLSLKGDTAAAQEAYDRALTIRKDFLPARVGKVEILLAQKDLPAAKAQLDLLKKLAPNDPQTNFLAAGVAFLNRDYKVASELCQQVLKSAPDHVKALQLAGTIEFHNGSLLRAADFLNKALHIANQAPTRRMLAQIYLRAANTMKALETLAPLLDAGDVDADTLSLAAQAHMQAGDIEKAEAYFGRAVARDPSDIKSRTALALSQFAKGKADLGYSQLQQVAAADSGTFADMALINAYFRHGKPDAALKAIGRLEKKDPGGPTAATLRGRAQLALKDFAGARKSFEAALKIDPLYYPAASKLAGLDLEDGKPELAKQRLEGLLKADPKNVQVLLALAELKSKVGGGQDEVTALLRDAIRFNPTVAAPRLRLIEHHLKGKEVKAALTAGQEGVAATPDNAELIDALGRVQVSAGDSNQAISSFKRLAELRPNSPQPLLRLAETYEAMNNIDAAHHSLKRALVIAPHFLAAQRGLIRLAMASGRPQEALAVAKSIQAAPGRQVMGSLFVGEIEEAQKHWDGAAAAYRAGLAKAPLSLLATKLHGAMAAGAHIAEAETFAAGWLKEHPRDVAFIKYLGDRALARSNYAVAESHYLTLVRLQPQDASAFNNLAWLTAQLKKPEALGYAEKANALSPNQPAFMDTLAMILAQRNEVGKALELGKRAVVLRPQDPAIRLTLARVYLQAGDKAHAKIELDKLAQLRDKFAGQAEVSKLLETL